MKHIINAVMDRIAECVPELRFIDVDLGQLQDTNPAVDFPCALVDITNIDFQDAGHRTQTAEANVSVRLGFRLMGPSSHHSSKTDREEAQQHYDLIEKVCEALYGFSTPEMATLTRTSIRRQPQSYPRHYVVSFKTGYTESFVEPTVPVVPKVEFKP